MLLFSYSVLHYKKEGRNCPVPIFREYFKKNYPICGEGVWSIANVIFLMRMNGYFYPKGCSFDRQIPKYLPRLSSCVRKLNLTKILVTSDSNGYKYRDQFQYFLCNQSNSCQLDSCGIQRYQNCSKPRSE